MLQPTFLLLKEMVQAITSLGGSGPGGPLWDAWIGLYTAQVPVVPSRLLADLTEPNYALYTRIQVPLWFGPYQDPDGSYEAVAARIAFAIGVNDAPVQVVGYFFADRQTGGNLLALEQWDQPFNMDNPDRACVFIPEVNLPPTLMLGSATPL